MPCYPAQPVQLTLSCLCAVQGCAGSFWRCIRRAGGCQAGQAAEAGRRWAQRSSSSGSSGRRSHASARGGHSCSFVAVSAGAQCCGCGSSTRRFDAGADLSWGLPRRMQALQACASCTPAAERVQSGSCQTCWFIYMAQELPVQGVQRTEGKPPASAGAATATGAAAVGVTPCLPSSCNSAGHASFTAGSGCGVYKAA